MLKQKNTPILFRHETGFTLLEILVAIALFCLGARAIL
jgi:prepilin-type N-terminal cleavage/methylation domain-containing protein